MNECNNCGAFLEENASFCQTCGMELNNTTHISQNNHQNQTPNTNFDFGDFGNHNSFNTNPNAGIIAKRGKVVMVQLVLNWILLPINVLISLAFFLFVDPIVGALWLLIDLWPLTWSIFWTITMANTPLNRIEYDGHSRLILHTSRGITEQINIADITRIADRPGSWFINGSLFSQDGAITITTTTKVYDFKFVSQTNQARQTLDSIRNHYFQSNPINRPF